MKLFKSYSEKEVKRVMPIVNKINSLDNSSTKEKKTLLNEIEKFQKKYNL